MKRPSPITIAVVVLAVPAALWLWWTAPDTAPVAAVRQVADSLDPLDQGEAVPSEPPAVLPIERLQAMVERPLFSATRRNGGLEAPTDLHQEAAPPAETPLGERYRLVGTINEAGRITAVIARHDGPTARVQRGDQLDEWLVTAINRDRVLVSKEGVAAELKLNGP